VQLRRLTLLAACASLCCSWAIAQTWPEKPIRLIVAYPAGGGVDLVARTLALRLSDALKQQVVVDNRGGASGSIGTDIVAKSAPDGYTLLMASPAEVIVGPAAGQKTLYNAELDFVPIALAGETPLVLVAHPSIPAVSLKEFVSYAKSNPGKLSDATPGSGSSMHFAGESFKAGTGAFMVHIPYRGAAPALNDALGNQVSVAIVGMPPTVAHVKAGRLRALGVTTAQRSSVMPDVPSITELPGLESYRFTNWMGVFAPARTPPAIVERLGLEIARIVKEPVTREKLAAAGVEPMGLTGTEFTSFLAVERQRYKGIARDRKIRFEE
jgi:tripartite-type tricarboxylate transporter receptor subunit TctC